jgi:hypothetical protein
LAAAEFIQRRKNLNLLDDINDAYDDFPYTKDADLQSKIRPPASQNGTRPMVINQGDIFWINLNKPSGSEPGYRYPHAVIQNNLFNRIPIHGGCMPIDVQPQKSHCTGKHFVE